MEFSNLLSSKWKSGFRHGLSLSVLIVLSACSTVQGQGSATASVTKYSAPEPTTPPNLKNMAPSDAVLELIQRVMKAAKTGVLMNEEATLKTLGLTMVPSTKPLSTRQILTGIAALDDDEEVRIYYGVNRDPLLPQTWAFSIRSISRLFCIEYSNVESKLGAPHGAVFPFHGQESGGWYSYFIYADGEKVEASFTYARVSETKRCLNHLSIRPSKR